MTVNPEDNWQVGTLGEQQYPTGEAICPILPVISPTAISIICL